MKMLTNHQKLQAAATAATHQFDPTRHDSRGLWIVRPGAWSQSDQVLWNPLDRDEDAESLREQFGLIVWPPTPDYPYTVCQNSDASVETWSANNRDKRRARCVTIVDAVIQIGKKK